MASPEMTMGTDEEFTLYSNLPLLKGSRSIRVLDVYSSSSSEDGGPILCDLRVCHLNSQICPSFTALSYVWGIKYAKSNFITCNSFTVEVTQNCHSALRHLRKKFGRFTIWIDAVCINQGDDDEKIEQIRLMGDIYSTARTVYVWLGESNAATNATMAYLETGAYLKYFISSDGSSEDETPKLALWSAAWAGMTARFNFTSNLFPLSSQNKKRLLRHLQCLTRGYTSVPANVSYEDLNELLNREWIKRIWTYQEILLASNPVVVCGDYHLVWSRFALGICFLEFSGINYVRGKPIVETLRQWAGVSMSRDHISVGTANYTRSLNGNTRYSTLLQRYQKFMIRVNLHIAWIQKVSIIGLGVSLMAVISLVLWWIMLRCSLGTSALPTEVPESVVIAATRASSKAAACGVACATSGLAACSEACGSASDAASYAASLSEKFTSQITYQTLDLGFGLPVAISGLIFLISFLLFLESAQTKYPKPRIVLPGHTLNLVEGLCYRKSKQKEDKAWALQAVLKKLSTEDFPELKNADSLEHLYKQLCIQLLYATGSLQFLLPAALNSFPGFLSWTPNWAAKFENFWLKPTLLQNRPRNATPGSYSSWRLDLEDDNILFVRGRQICTALDCFRFKETLSFYSSDQKDLHLHNLSLILNLWKSSGRAIRMMLEFEEMKEFGVLELIDHQQFDAWIKFLRVSHKQSPTELLNILARECPTSISRSENRIFSGRRSILRTQIKVCNNFVRTQRMPFKASAINPGNSIEKRIAMVFGIDPQKNWEDNRTLCIGTYSVQAGDAVVLIAGVSLPLVIRRDRRETRLISPAIVTGVMDGEIWDAKWRNQDLEEYVLS